MNKLFSKKALLYKSADLKRKIYNYALQLKTTEMDTPLKNLEQFYVVKDLDKLIQEQKEISISLATIQLYELRSQNDEEDNSL